MKKKRQQASRSVFPLIEVPLYPDAVQCVLMSLQYVSPVQPLHPLNWLFQAPN